MGGGAWPFLVGGVICLVNSVNERDQHLLNTLAKLLACMNDVGRRGLTAVSSAAGLPGAFGQFGVLRRTAGFKPEEAVGNNRSVMPLDVLGRTRATMNNSTSVRLR